MVSNQEIDEFSRLRAAAEVLYKSFKPSFCPALKGEVQFTSEGFNHLRYKFNVARTEAAQRRKLKVLLKGQEIIKITTTIQEYRTGITKVGKPGRDGLRKTSIAQYWGFVHVFPNNVRVRVIIRQVGDGQLHFWSVMPSWKVNKRYDGSTVRDVGSMDMETE